MANLSDQTRKEQVLAYLQAHLNEWVDGPSLANEKVGGSEGLRRLRELTLEDSYPIIMRKHPDPTRSVWQYKLVGANDGDSPSPVSPIPDRRTPTEPITSLKGLSLGDVRICPACRGKTWVIDHIKPGSHHIQCTKCAGMGVVRT